MDVFCMRKVNKWTRKIETGEELIERFALDVIHQMYINDTIDDTYAKKVYTLIYDVEKIYREKYKKYKNLYQGNSQIFHKIDEILHPNSEEKVYILIYANKYHNEKHYKFSYDRELISLEFAKRLGYKKCKVCMRDKN